MCKNFVVLDKSSISCQSQTYGSALVSTLATVIVDRTTQFHPGSNQATRWGCLAEHQFWMACRVVGQELNCVHPETSQYMELDAKSNRARWAKIKKLYEQWDTQLISNVDTVTADWQLSAMRDVQRKAGRWTLFWA